MTDPQERVGFLEEALRHITDIAMQRRFSIGMRLQQVRQVAKLALQIYAFARAVLRRGEGR